MARQPDTDIAKLISKFERLPQDKLAAALAEEFLALRQQYKALEARLASMETLQTINDQIAATKRGDLVAPLPGTVRLESSHALHNAAGLYHLEYDADGTPFRWSGPESHFSVPMFIDRRNGAEFRIEFGALYAEGDVADIQCLVDAELVTTSVTRQGTGYELAGRLPVRTGAEGSVLTVVLPAMSAPTDRGENDHRKLGISFRRLRAWAAPDEAAA